MLQSIHKVTDLTDLMREASQTLMTKHHFHLGASGGSTPLLVPGMPASFAELLTACLRIDPRERATAAELLTFRCAP